MSITAFAVALAVFSARADGVVGATSGFEGYSAGDAFTPDALEDKSDQWFWNLPASESYENSSKIAAHDSSGIPADYVTDQFTNDTSNALYLQVNIESTTNLVRNLCEGGKTNITESGIWLDMDVRFSVAYGRPEPYGMDKILVWVGDSSSGLSGVSGTNLIVTAGHIDNGGNVSAANYILQGDAITDANFGDWHRLTIACLKDGAYPVFEVYLDNSKIEARRSGSNDVVSRFPSLIPIDDDDRNFDNLSCATFGGLGSLDNFAVQDYRPDLRVFYYFEIENVGEYLTFADALKDAADGATIRLRKDYTGGIFVYGAKTNTLDLAGHSITNAPYDNTVSVAGGSKLTIIGSGSLVQNSTGGFALVANNAVVCIGDGENPTPTLAGGFAVREPYVLDVFDSVKPGNKATDLKSGSTINSGAWSNMTELACWRLTSLTNGIAPAVRQLVVELSKTNALYEAGMPFPELTVAYGLDKTGEKPLYLASSNYAAEWDPKAIVSGGVYTVTVTIDRAVGSASATAVFNVATNEDQLAALNSALASSLLLSAVSPLPPNYFSLTDEQNKYYASLFSPVSSSAKLYTAALSQDAGETEYELNETGISALRLAAAEAAAKVLEAVRSSQSGDGDSNEPITVEIDSIPGFYWSLDQGDEIGSMAHEAGNTPTPTSEKGSVRVIKGSGNSRFYQVIFSRDAIEPSTAD